MKKRCIKKMVTMEWKTGGEMDMRNLLFQVIFFGCLMSVNRHHILSFFLRIPETYTYSFTPPLVSQQVPPMEFRGVIWSQVILWQSSMFDTLNFCRDNSCCFSRNISDGDSSSEHNSLRQIQTEEWWMKKATVRSNCTFGTQLRLWLFITSGFRKLR